MRSQNTQTRGGSSRNDVYREETYREDRAGEIQALSGINFILGIWLIISPWIIGYVSASAKWDQVGIGIAVLILAAIREVAPSQHWASFLNGLVGVWALIAPIFLYFGRPAGYWNSIIVGIVIAILAFWNSSLHIAGNGRTGHHSTV